MLGPVLLFADTLAPEAARLLHMLGPAFRHSFMGDFMPPLDYDLYHSTLSEQWVAYLQTDASAGAQNVAAAPEGAAADGPASTAALCALLPMSKVLPCGGAGAVWTRLCGVLLPGGRASGHRLPANRRRLATNRPWTLAGMCRLATNRSRLL